MWTRSEACFRAVKAFIFSRIDIDWWVWWEIQAVCVCIVDFTRFLQFVSVLLEFDLRSQHWISMCAFWHCQIDLLGNLDRWKQFRDFRDWRDEKKLVSNVNTRETWLLSHRFVGVYRHAVRYRHVLSPAIRAACMTVTSNCSFSRLLIGFAGIISSSVFADYLSHSFVRILYIYMQL
jgi:hypothetical protein